MAIKSVFKKLGAAVLGAGSSLIIAACYGVYYGDWMKIAGGRVESGDGTGIPEMQVCVELTSTNWCETTDQNGDFYVAQYEDQFNDADQNGFTLQVRDVDGAANGEWADEDVTVGSGRAGEDFDITVDPVTP